MDLATLEPALAAIVRRITDFTNVEPVQWENEPRKKHNGRIALLSWVSVVATGVDETQWAYAANADPLLEMTPTVIGQRKATLQVSVEVHDQRAGHTARAVLELARTRLQAPSVLALLAAVGLAFAGTESVLPADYRVDQRWIARAILDVHLNAMSTFADTDGRASYIANVVASANITHPDGTAVDPDL